MKRVCANLNDLSATMQSGKADKRESDKRFHENPLWNECQPTTAQAKNAANDGTTERRLEDLRRNDRTN
jgi:hypothetical protein